MADLQEVIRRIFRGPSPALSIASEDEFWEIWQTISLSISVCAPPPELVFTPFTIGFRWAGKMIQSELRDDWDEHVDRMRAAGWVN